MADTVTDQNEVMETTSRPDPNVGTVTVIRTADIQGSEEEQVNEEYILQQAFEEASEALTNENGQSIHIRYTTDDGVELQEADIVNTTEGPVHFVTDGSPVSTTDNAVNRNHNNASFQVITANSTDENVYVPEPVTDTGQHEIVEPMDNSVIDENSMSYISDASNQGIQIQSQDIQTVPHVSLGAEMTLLAANSAPSGAPLGSSQNPIRIIQQGNQYIPVQQLSTDQLQQIMQVVQQQQLTKQSSELGSSVLFNPQTNTRIVYRVIYPSELHKDGDVTKTKEQQTVVVQAPQKRTYKKRHKDDEEEKIDAPELTKEEKEVRKKMRPKTRSGRVSKPPKHMVKDFKHIHVLDYDEDYDDSDGGYSDFKQSDPEEDDESSRSSSKKEEDGVYIMPGISSLKPKKWKCITCQKAYIGRAGLSRHLKLYPTHGKLDPDSEEMEPNSSEVTPTDSVDTPRIYIENGDSTYVTAGTGTVNGVSTAINGINSAASLSEDSRDSSSSISYTPKPRGRGFRGRPPWKGRGRGRPRGAYSMDPELRRKNKLKEVVRDSTDEELMEIVLPRLTKVITLWEFLLMKVEKGNPTRPHADDIYKEYMKLHEHVKRLCQEYLQCIPSDEVSMTDTSILRVDESAVAESLGLRAGPHRVKEISEDDSTYEYKLITTNKSVYQDYTNRSFLKRTVEVVSPQELISPQKKARTVEDVKPKLMPVSFTDKLKTFVPLSTNTVLNVSGATQSPSLMPVTMVTQPNQTTVFVNNASQVVQPKPGIVYLNANNVKKETAIIPSPITPNQVFVPNVTKIDMARNSLQTQKTVAVQPGTGTSLLKQSTIAPSSLQGQSIANPVSLLKPSVVTSTNPQQKFIIVPGTNATGVNKDVNFDVVRQTGSKTKEVVLNSLNSLSSSFVNTPSQVPNSLISPPASSNIIISPPTSSNIIVQTALPNASTLLPSNIVTSLGSSSDSVSLLNNKIYAKGNNQQPISYIAVPISQPTQPQISSFRNHPPGTVVLQPVMNSLSNSLPVSTTKMTTLIGNTVTSAYDVTQPSTVLKNLHSAIDTNSNNPQTVVEPISANVSSMKSGNIPESKISSVEISAQSDIIDDKRVFASSHDSSGNVILQLNSEMEQKLETAHEDQQNISDAVNDSDVDIEQVEQIDNSNAALSSSFTTNGETLGVINSIDASGSQPEPVESSDTDISMLVDNENVVPVEESEDVQLDSLPDRSTQEETIHIPATNIYQTEDGYIIIQNPDGTTMQLQGTDGQSIPIETIQALLAMDGETQLITEQSEDAVQQ